MTHLRPLVFSLALLGCGASSSPAAPPAATDASSDASSDATADAGLRAMVRGQRYCEVLAGSVSGANVALDVYSTFGLNDCPDAAWRALTVAALRAELGVPVVVLNGPRYWLIDAFEAGMVLDPTVRTIGGIAMRVAGRVEVPVAVATTGNSPYADRTIRRDSTVRFSAGSRVYELVDNASHVYVMQSYTVQREAQTEATLAELGARLTLPTGWRFRTRVLDADVRIVAEGGMATVTTDDLGNTYQRSLQTP